MYFAANSESAGLWRWFEYNFGMAALRFGRKFVKGFCNL